MTAIREENIRFLNQESGKVSSVSKSKGNAMSEKLGQNITVKRVLVELLIKYHTLKVVISKSPS